MSDDRSREAWWERAVVYQVYPRSFQDSDGDGIGDLAGITQRLDYLANLGVDAVWISPIYPSPMADFGYDVADYTGVDPRFGTLADFDALLARAHALGLKVLLDFVPNHSSDRHPWFVESRSSRTSPKRDWYIWRDAAPDGGAPNNWISDFGGSAWQWDEGTGQYYLHAFLKEQPDLNWRNPDVKAAMLDAMRFWFDRGVDGFRIDVLWHMVKHADLPDNPPNPAFTPDMGEMHRVLQLHSTDQGEVHAIAAEMRALADRYGAVLIGEIYLPVDRLMTYYGSADAPGVHLPFNFALIEAPWNAAVLRDLIADYEAALPPGGWPNWVLGNHDRPRAATRLGEAQARVAMMMLLTLRGTPTIYYGDELGFEDAEVPAALVQDPRELLDPGKGLGRDPVRAPMAWNAGPNGGFTTGTPWLPPDRDWRRRNVAVEDAEAGSMLALTRALLALRRERPSLATGDFALLDAPDGVLAYERRQGAERTIIALNLTDEPRRIDIEPGLAPLLSSTRHASEGWHLSSESDPSLRRGDGLVLQPNEGIILA